MFPEPNPTPDQEKSQEPIGDTQPVSFGSAMGSPNPLRPPAIVPTRPSSPFTATAPSVASTPSPVAPRAAESDSYDQTALSLYIVTMFSGISILVSASYLVWNALAYFTKPADGFSFFDLSSLTIYALIYLVLFATVYALASLRLDNRIRQAGGLERPLRTASAVWRALLVVWGVAAFVGLLYSPLSASLDGGDSSSLVSEITSAVVGLVLIGLLFWRDLSVQKIRDSLVALGVISSLVVVIAGANAFASLNPKESKEETLDYSSSMYDDYNFEDTSNSSETTENTEEYNFDFESTSTDDTTSTDTAN